jgi:septum formation protein
LPEAHALRLAKEKAMSVARLPEAAGAVVLGADTVVACGRRILPKAEDEQTARDCLALLSGRRHRVIGGIAALTPAVSGKRASASRSCITTVAFKRLAAAEIEHYIGTGEWQGKAGGYAIQGRAAVFVRFLRGSYSNVVGLPLFETERLLEGLGAAAGGGGGEP